MPIKFIIVDAAFINVGIANVNITIKNNTNTLVITNGLKFFKGL